MTANHDPSRVFVADDVILDGRLALFHRRQSWLAVADLHFGYELSQRAAGRLVPLWGMNSIEQRLAALLEDYRPRDLVILGDLVHDRASARDAQQLIGRLGELTNLILLAGNHDRQLARSIPMLRSWESDGFYFHHGDCAAETSDRTQIIGHHHPSGTIRDGAGLRLKLPAFVSDGGCWILPAFSPWAGGVDWPTDRGAQIWLCTPTRILPLPKTEASAA